MQSRFMKWKNAHIILFMLLFIVITQKSDAHGNDLFCKLENISIEGKTNINHFRFIYDSSNAKKVQFTQNQSKKSFSRDAVKFELPVKTFESSNKKMNRDFYKMLNASYYPKIIVAIKKSKLRQISNGRKLPSLNMDLTLAGETKTVETKCNYKKTSPGNTIIMKGITRINLREFSLSPPKKMLGLIEVKETIFINFEVALNKNT